MAARWLKTVLAGLLLLASLSGAAGAVLKPGSRGESVVALQKSLIALGLLAGPSDGVFGTATRNAVCTFQRQQGLRVDGLVGTATWSHLQVVGGGRPVVHLVSRGETLYGIARRYRTSPAAVISLNHLGRPDRLQPGQKLVVEARREDGSPGPEAVEGGDRAEPLAWSVVDKLFTNGMEAKVYDVRTGLSFRVRRIQGTYHADCEPLTREDTAVMKVAYGGAWSWNRHPVIVQVAGRRLAASMNGNPHGSGHYARNSFPGHFCIHFNGSRTHGSRLVDPDHQAAVMVAARAGK